MPRTARKPAAARAAGSSGRSRGALRTRAVFALRLLLTLGIIALIFFGAWVIRRPILRGAAHLVTVRDEPRRADAILLLGGDYDVRPEEAARLYTAGLAPQVLLVREKDSPATKLGVVPNTSDASVAVMRRLGVPASAIRVLRVPDGATSTQDESRAFREWAYNAKPTTVIAVTSAFHSRRARWLLRRQLDRLRVTVLMDGVKDWEFDESNWWQNKRGLTAYVEEYLKFGYDFFRD